MDAATLDLNVLVPRKAKCKEEREERREEYE
jgi:hypothetical protein